MGYSPPVVTTAGPFWVASARHAPNVPMSISTPVEDGPHRVRFARVRFADLRHGRAMGVRSRACPVAGCRGLVTVVMRVGAFELSRTAATACGHNVWFVDEEVPEELRLLTVMMLLWGIGSLPLAVVGVTWSFPVMAIALFVVGLASGAGMVIWGTLLQRRVPAHMLGRVSSLDFFVSLSFMPLSMAVAGPLSKVVAVETIFAAAGLLPIVLAIVALAAARMPSDEIAHPLD